MIADSDAPIKPCPFCGIEPAVRGHPTGCVFLVCENPDCFSVVEVAGDSYADALRRWNDRPATPLPVPALSRLIKLGLITAGTSGYRLTDAGRALFAAAGRTH